MSESPKMLSVALDRIFLDLENPRHEPYDDEPQVIDYLCRFENVFPLAKDITTVGLNPLELFALIPDDGAHPNAEQTYIVAEGNRRICALKLLDDSERAPAKLRKPFEEIAQGWIGAGDLPCMIFTDREAVDLWLTRIHDGEQGGIGRRKWNADQSARHSGTNKNKIALAVLDHAEASKMITAEQRKGKLTTVQRYLVNPIIREAMGIDASNPNDLARNRNKADFDLLLRKFLRDLAEDKVNSRAKKDQIEAYARELSASAGQSHDRIQPSQSIKIANKGVKAGPTPRPKKHRARRFIGFEPEIFKALEGLSGSKLPNLYTSICSVTLESHTPLVAIGAWAFLESLSSKAGRPTQTGFPDFFSNNRLAQYGIAKGKGDHPIRDAVRRISTSGDVTKHDGTAAQFNGEQLANDMETLKNLILKCIEEAASATP
jgi:hypothetical protein